MKAKRGDIAVIVSERTDLYIGQENRTYTEVTVNEVTSITREGIVKAIRPAGWENAILMTNRARHSALYVIPRAEFDIPAALESARGHTYPNSTTTMAYASIDEVKTMLRAHRRIVVSKGVVTAA